MTAIIDIHGREILDSRGNPTVEVDVLLEDGSFGRAAVPSGASTGAHEAVELRDGDKSRYLGKGVLEGRDAVNGEISDALLGFDAEDQRDIDLAMIALDGTENKSRLGANAILGVAGRRQGRRQRARPAALCLCRRRFGHVLPVPMMNIINGGEHADNPIDFQEFMIMPVGAPTWPKPCAGARKSSTRSRRASTKRAWRRRWATRAALRPNLASTRDALDFIMASIEKAGFKAGHRHQAGARLRGDRVLQGRQVRDQRRGPLAQRRSKWPITSPTCATTIRSVSIEDGMGEDDFEGWKALTDKIGDKVQLVGDDLFVTNPKRLTMGIGRASPIRCWSRSTRSAR
jgi:enolase